VLHIHARFVRFDRSAGGGITDSVSDAAGGFRRNIRRTIRKQSEGINLTADIDAAIAVNTGGDGTATVSRSVHRTAISQAQRGRPAADAASTVTDQTGDET
jgi:hypothetical protein